VKTPQTLMFYARDALVGNAALSWWMGGERTGNVATAGWSWVDGTSAENLNCGGAGCGGVWAAVQDGYRAQPDNFRGVVVVVVVVVCFYYCYCCVRREERK
jgi:hypothetical protein